jgi:hypothetical protein
MTLPLQVIPFQLPLHIFALFAQSVFTQFVSDRTFVDSIKSQINTPGLFPSADHIIEHNTVNSTNMCVIEKNKCAMIKMNIRLQIYNFTHTRRSSSVREPGVVHIL